jgi:phosphoribosylglycinamide formyltransferase-1
VNEIKGKVGTELMKTHRSYWPIMRRMIEADAVSAMAHITGGGITENLPRALPKGTGAIVEINSWPVPPIFDHMQEIGNVPQDEMLRTFNMGIGMILVVPAKKFKKVQTILDRCGEKGYTIGRVVKGERGLQALLIPSKGRLREEHDREVVAALKQDKVDVVCLAGYMRLLSPWFVQQFPQKILNIHPSLLPAFPGLEAQEQAFAYGVKVSGCTVHFVDEELDHGAIIVQKTVPVLETDDEHSLAARILEQEHVAYTEAINVVLDGKLEIAGRRLRLRQK